MTAAGWGQLLALIVLILVTAPLLGRYMANVYEGSPSPARPGVRAARALASTACVASTPSASSAGTSTRSRCWRSASSRSSSSTLIQRLQGEPAVQPDRHARTCTRRLAFNTAVSFVTNTNWQSYYRETTMSHLTQTLGLTVQNFVSAAVGMAVMVALIRGLARAGSQTIGNFWVDLVRTTLPDPPAARAPLRGHLPRRRRDPEPARLRRRSRPSTGAKQAIPGGPVASQVAIKQLGTNGGGFFNTNSAHPFENADAVQQLLRDLRDPAHPVRAGVHLRPHGRRTSARAGPCSRSCSSSGWRSRPWRSSPRSTATRASPPRRRPDGHGDVARREHGGQGGPLRPGRVGRSGPSSTTNTSNGSVNSMHDSATPIGGGVAAHGHEARRGQPGRCRRGPQRHVDLRHPRGVHRRPHGRAHARVPGEEDPGDRDQARRALHPRHAARRARVPRRIGVRRFRRATRPIWNPGSTASARCSTRTPRRRTTTARRSPASPPTRSG